MSLGRTVRSAFGPFERPVADAYRRIFVDLNALVAQVQAWVPAPSRILEIGCGEGAMTERLARAYPDAAILAIDVSPAVGRLFRGHRPNVELRQATLEAVVSHEPEAFDLVLLCDVLHHVPGTLHRDFLRTACGAVGAGGVFVFKDWALSRTPIHWMCAFSDRYLTGDNVCYHTASELRELAREAFGRRSVLAEAMIRPWRNNHAFLLQREA